MKHLLEISNIVTWKKVKKIELFDESALKNKSSKFNEFFEALMDGKFRNDRDASALLYGCSPTDDKYRQLKSRFRKRLMNTLFFIDVNRPSASGYSQAYFSCNKDWTLIKILQIYGAKETAKDLARQVLTTSLKFRFADLIINCARILRETAAEENNEKDFLQYNDLLVEFQQIIEVELKSEEYYQKAFITFEKTKISKANNIKELDTYCNELIAMSESVQSPVVTFNMFLTWVIKLEIENDAKSIIEICNKMEEYISSNPQYEQRDKIELFQLKKMNALFQLHDINGARSNAEMQSKYLEEASKNWYNFMELFFLTAMHTDNYINALAILNKVTTLSKFRKSNRNIKEKWKIYEYYLYYFLEKMGNQYKEIYQAKSTALFSKLLSDPVIYAKEMRLYTIQTVIVQVLIAIDNKNFLYAAENIERLKSYTKRQMNEDENKRVLAFIKLLIQLMKSNFNPKFITGDEKHLEILHNTPIKDNGKHFDIEIYPYEKIWKILLSKLN